MKVLVDKNTNVIIHIGQKADLVVNGMDVGGLVYGGETLWEVVDVKDVPDAVKVQTHKYVDGAFVVNAGYIKSNPETIADLTTSQQELRQTVLNQQVNYNGLKDDLADQNQMLSDFMEFVCSQVPELN